MRLSLARRLDVLPARQANLPSIFMLSTTSTERLETSAGLLITHSTHVLAIVRNTTPSRLSPAACQQQTRLFRHATPPSWSTSSINPRGHLHFSMPTSRLGSTTLGSDGQLCIIQPSTPRRFRRSLFLGGRSSDLRTMGLSFQISMKKARGLHIVPERLSPSTRHGRRMSNIDDLSCDSLEGSSEFDI